MRVRILWLKKRRKKISIKLAFNSLCKKSRLIFPNKLIKTINKSIAKSSLSKAKFPLWYYPNLKDSNLRTILWVNKKYNRHYENAIRNSWKNGQSKMHKWRQSWRNCALITKKHVSIIDKLCITCAWLTISNAISTFAINA